MEVSGQHQTPTVLPTGASLDAKEREKILVTSGLIPRSSNSLSSRCIDSFREENIGLLVKPT